MAGADYAMRFIALAMNRLKARGKGILLLHDILNNSTHARGFELGMPSGTYLGLSLFRPCC